MPSDSADDELLRRALELARAGIGLASPNPYVGAVVADEHGSVVGTGTYTYADVKHAEILALEAAGAKARGGTLYINLEPHDHQGRTPPCTEALIQAGIRRVVACMADPNPKVSGRGFNRLRAAGIKVETGKFEDEARRLNEAFACYIRQGMPLVTLKSAMTLDGKIAPPQNDHAVAADGFAGTWITGKAARAHVQQLRHQHDAILVGVRTILADNPLLTDRSGRARRRPLLRVILDSHLRLPIESRLVRSAAASPESDVMVFCSFVNVEKKKALERLGIQIEQVKAEGNDQRPDLRAILRRLAELEIIGVLIEGGATINRAALASNVVEKLVLYYAPTILGRADAVSFLASPELGQTKEPVHISNLQLHRFEEDFAVEGYLRDPYGD